MTEIAPGARLEGRDLSGADWRALACEDAAFIACTFEDVQFSETVARGARFERCTFRRCRFAHADLREAVFEDCVLADRETRQGPAFAFSDLSQAHFTRCDLSYASIERCDCYAIAFESCAMIAARFLRADFSRAFGRKVVRTSAKITDCRLDLADLREVRLPGCDLSRSTFGEADLTLADLEEADLRETNLFHAILAGAKLTGADLRGAELSGVDLATLGAYAGAKITLTQQYALLTAMGLDVRAA